MCVYVKGGNEMSKKERRAAYQKEYYKQNRIKIRAQRMRAAGKSEEEIRHFIAEQTANKETKELTKDIKYKIAALRRDFAEVCERVKKEAEMDKKVLNNLDAVIAEKQSEVISEHSLCSPSALERITNCTSSVVLSKDIPQAPASAVAEEGTLYHSYLEDLLANPPQDEPEYRSRLQEIQSAEMMQHVEGAYNYITDIIFKIKPIRTDIECRLKAFYSDSDFGTLDVGMVYLDNNHKTNVLVLDWKYGRGTYVEAEQNKQLAAYAMSYCMFLKSSGVVQSDIDNIITVVYQPRCKSEDGKIARVCAYTKEELMDVCEFIKDRVAVAYKLLTASAEEVQNNTCAGEHCLFCPAKPLCKAYKELVTADTLQLLTDLNEIEETSVQSDVPAVVQDKKAITVKDAVNFKDVSLLSDDDILKIVTFNDVVMPKLKSYIEDVLTFTQNRLETGETIDGLKLVENKGRRKWIEDTELVINTLNEVGVDGTKPALKTLTEITAALKAIGKVDVLDSLVTMSQGTVRVALESDKRAVVESTLLTDL